MCITWKIFPTKQSNLFNEYFVSYIEHAKAEFAALGYKPVDQCEDDPNKWIQENVFELLDVLGTQGHSGSSIYFVVDYFSKLALFKPLCPLTGQDEEWGEPFEGTSLLQNKRCSHVFKVNGVAYTIDGYQFWHWSEIDLDPDEEGYPGKRTFRSYFTSRESRKLVTFPYTPTTESVEVECYEVNKETDEREPGSGWWHTVYPDFVVKNTAEVDVALNL